MIPKTEGGLIQFEYLGRSLYRITTREEHDQSETYDYRQVLTEVEALQLALNVIDVIRDKREVDDANEVLREARRKREHDGTDDA